MRHALDGARGCRGRRNAIIISRDIRKFPKRETEIYRLDTGRTDRLRNAGQHLIRMTGRRRERK